MRTQLNEMTPRERDVFNQERELLEMRLAHDVKIRELELEIVRVESKIGAWFRLPLYILKLPVLVILAFGYCVDRFRGNEPSDAFWSFLK